MTTHVKESKNIYMALVSVRYGPSNGEKDAVHFRRSLYFTRDMKEGETIGTDDVRSIRPGFGLSTEFIDIVRGRKVTRDVKKRDCRRMGSDLKHLQRKGRVNPGFETWLTDSRAG